MPRPRSNSGWGIKLCGVTACLLGLGSALLAVYLASVTYPSLFEAPSSGASQAILAFESQQVIASGLGGSATLMGVWPLIRRFWFAALGISFGLLGALLKGLLLGESAVSTAAAKSSVCSWSSSKSACMP